MKDYFLYTKCLITQQILKNRAVMRMHYAVVQKRETIQIVVQEKK